MKNYNFIFLRLSLYLTAGILTAFLIPVKESYLFITDFLVLLFFFAAFLNYRKNLFPNHFNGLVFFLSIFFLGFNSGHFNKPVNQEKHLIHFPSGNYPGALLEGIIVEELKPNSYNNRFILEVSRIIPKDNTTLDIKGKLLMNIQKDSGQTSYQIGNRLLIPFNIKEIQGPKNPFQFDYKAYMSNLKVENQINLSTEEIIRSKESGNSILSFSNSIRKKLIHNLKKNDFSGDELAVFQALILGERRDLSDELVNQYASAGAIHILAISGLHIGILLILLNFLLKPIETLKNGKLLKSILLILLLWSFAMITGFSPSVVRAVTMFSFLAVGMQLNRKTSSLNSLFLSFFFLVLINPYYLFQVGFQLSYLAVLGIILLQPIINGLFDPSNRLIKYFYQLISASIAAQIAVLPLALYYFHQFPGLFLVSNILILPVLSLIVIGGILTIVLATIGILPPIITNVFELLLNLLNTVVSKIAGYKSFIFEDISFSFLQTLSLYAVLIILLYWIWNPDFRKSCILLFSIILFQFTCIHSYLKIPDFEVIVFHGKYNSAGIKSKKELTIYNSIPSKNILKDYSREREIEMISEAKESILDFKNLKILVVDSNSIYSIEGFRPDIVILSNSPKINLDRLIHTLNPSQIVANGTNYPSFVQDWKNTCFNKKIPFHYTGEKGAYIYN